MAVSFTDKNMGFVNTWTQLHDIVSTKSLYNKDDYENLSTQQKENYLLMLYQNNDALEERLPEEYSADYGDFQTRYSLLFAENQKYTYTNNISKPEYRAQLQAQFDQQFNSQLSGAAKQGDGSWIDWLVENKYSGSYAQFLADYSGDNAKSYTDVLPEMVPSEYGLTEESFAAGISDLKSQYDTSRKEFDNQVSTAYGNTLQAVRDKIANNAKQAAYDNAGWLEKTLNTAWQIPTLMTLELGNIVEGIVDATLGVVAGAVELFGDSSGIQDIIKTELWAPDTYILNTVSNSYLSQYADDNIAKTMYQVGVSIVDMAPMLIPVAGPYLYYASSAGRTLESELNAGTEFGKAFAYTVGATAIEWATEKISGDVVFGKGLFDKLDSLGNKNLLAKVTHDFFGEGVEELISGIGSGIWHGVTAGEYQLDGKDLAESFLVGGLVGGIMAAGNGAYTRHIITRTGVKLQGASGKTITISPKQAVILDNYVKQTAAKIKDGKVLSEREQRRFDRVKDFKIVDTEFTNRSLKQAIKSVDLNKLQAKSYQVKSQPGFFDSNNPVMPATNDIEEENRLLREKAEKMSGAPNESDFVSETKDLTAEQKRKLAGYIYDLTDADDVARAQKDFELVLVNTLGKIRTLFGDDVITKGIEGFSKYCGKTIDQLGELLNIDTENSDFARSNKTIPADLQLAFKNADFMLVTAENGEVVSKYDSVDLALDNLRSTLIKNKAYNFKNPISVELFFTNSDSVSTSFFIGNTLYISANWLQKYDIGHIKDVIVSKTLAENARLKLMKTSPEVSNMLWDAVSKTELPDRSPLIVLQELCYSMIYVKSNTLMNQLMAFKPKSSRFVVEYFNKLRMHYADVSVQKAAGQALTNMVQACKDSFGDESDTKDAVLPADKTESIESMINEYKSHEYRALPFVTGKNGIPADVAKANAAYIHLQKVYGFNKKLDLAKDNLLREFSNPKNYSTDGWSRLNDELQKYQVVESRTGHVFGTAVVKKGFTELLNYYLDITCGIMLTRDGYIATSEFTTKLLDYDAISTALKSVDTVSVDRKPIGQLSDFITEYTKNRLSQVFLDADVYVSFDSNSNEQAIIIGTPTTKMGIVINVAGIDTAIKESTTVGGKQFKLSSDGEIVKLPDGSYDVMDYTMSVPKPASIVGHELGHAIGMMLKFNGSFCDDDIASVWAKYLVKNMPQSKSAVNMHAIQFAESIKKFFLDEQGNIRHGREALIYCLPNMRKDTVTKMSSNERTKTIKDYLDKVGRLGMHTDKNTIATLLSPVATYLYYTGYANEMYANGKAEVIARTDLIHSRDATVRSGDFPARGRTILYLEEGYKKDAPEFIAVLDGADVDGLYDYGVDEMIDNALDSAENVTRRVYKTVKSNIASLKEAFDIEADSALVDPDFWAKKIDLTKPENSKFSLSKAMLIDGLGKNYDCHYDSIEQEFKPGYIQKYIPPVYDTIPRKNENYNVLFLNNGDVVNTQEISAYNEESDITAAVIYTPEKGKKPAMVTVRLESADLTPDIIARLNEVFAWVPNKDYRRVIADGRTFVTARAARSYLSNKPIATSNPNFETIFEYIIDTATSGRRLDYQNGDTIYMTTDGKIYNLDVDMFAWYSAANKVSDNIFGMPDANGNFQTNDERVTEGLSKFFDEKHLLRLYRTGDSWSAYGIPNKLQDTLIRELRAERMSQTPYIEVESNQRLFVNTKGDAHVEIHTKNWSDPDFIEVEWRTNEWYETIRQIMTKYNIGKFSEFKNLGFTSAFVAQLQKSVGIERTNKTTGKKYLTPGGINEQFIKDYIRDGSNPVLSKNILIENAPASKTDGTPKDWKNNAHIRSIQDAKAYFDRLKAKGMLLQDDMVYSSWLTFDTMTEKAKDDPALRDANTANGNALMTTQTNLGTYECYIQLLNMDANTETPGLLINRESFRQAIKGLNRYGSRERVANKETGLTKTSSDDEEFEYIPSDIDLDDIVAAKDKVSPNFKAFVNEILAIRKKVDPEERNKDFKELLESTKLPRYDLEDMTLIRNVIINEMDGTALQIERQKQIETVNKRIEKYKQLKEDSPEQLKERKRIIQYFEQLGNFRTRLIAKGGMEYYKGLREAAREIGAYSMNMNEKFSNAMAKAEKLRERVGNKDKFDEIIENFQETRDDILQIDKEYPGWYKTYEDFIAMVQAWLSGKDVNGKSVKAVAEDVNNFIEKWKADTAFRDSIAARERVKTYAATNAVRGYAYTDADLEQFKNIPDELEDLAKLPKQARDLYDNFFSGALPIEVLSNLLSDSKVVLDFEKKWGIDFVYHLQRLYNDLITPATGSIQKSKQADWLASILKKAGATKEQVDNAVISRSDAKKTAEKMASDEYLDYQKFMLNYATKGRTWLAEGTPVTAIQKRDSLRRMAREIKDRRWLQKEDKKIFRIDLRNLNISRSGDIDKLQAAYNKAQTAYDKAHAEFVGAHNITEALSGDRWFEAYRYWPKGSDSRNRLMKIASNISADEKHYKQYLEYIENKEKELADQREILADQNKRLYELENELSELKFTDTSHIQAEIARLESWFETERQKIADMLGKDDGTIMQGLIMRHTSRWAALNTAREKLSSYSSEFEVRDNLEGRLKILRAEIAETERTISLLEESIANADVPSIDSDIPADLLKERDALLAENSSKLPYLQKSRDILKAALDEAEAKYLSMTEKYNAGDTVKVVNTDGKYRVTKDSESAATKDTRRIQHLRDSYAQIYLKELSEYTTKRVDENIIEVYVSPTANKQLREVARLLNTLTAPYTEIDGNVEVQKKLSQLTPRSKKYRIMTAIMHAYYNFMEDPATNRSINRFENDVAIALADGVINATIPGDIKKRRLTIHVPQQYITPLEKGGTAITQEDIDKRLHNIFTAQLVDPNNQNDLAKIESYRETLIAAENAIQETVDHGKTDIDKLREKMRQRRKHDLAYSHVQVVSAGKYNITFNRKRGTFEDESGMPIDADAIHIGRLTEDEYTKYLDYTIHDYISKGIFELDPDGIIKVAQPYGGYSKNEVFAFPWDLSKTSEYYKPVSSVFPTAVLASDIPEESDFEGGVSKRLDPLDLDSLESLGLEAEPEKPKTPKGSWTENAVTVTSKNTNTLLSYKPKNYDASKDFIMNSAEFIEDNAVYLNTFVNSEADMNEFVTWVESNPSIPLNSPQEAIIFALLNKTALSVTASRSLKKRAEYLVNALGSRAGRTLGMFKRLGVTPVDQMIGMIQKFFDNLTDDELRTLKMAAENQANAIKVHDYAAAERQMQYVLDIVKAHADQLPVSMNIFAKGLSEEERTARMHNIIEKITAWRYFAMLGAPSTFFTKNIASNVIITGMNYAAEKIASILPKGKRLAGDYAFNDEDFDGIVGLTDAEQQAIRAEELAKRMQKVAGTVLTDTERERIESDAATTAQRRINEAYKNLQTLSENDIKNIVTKIAGADAKNIDTIALTKVLNAFIKTRYSVQKRMPNQKQLAAHANEWMRKQFYQYRIDKKAGANSKTVVANNLVKNGLLDSIMHGSVSKYDAGYKPKLGKLRDLTLNPETSFDDISEENASILIDAINQDSPFKWELLNKYYRFIFKTMEWGDKKFIRPKIIQVVENLVESNMTEAEIEALNNGDGAARAKFEQFVAYAVDDTMKTYFRSDSDLQVKIMRLFNGHPVAQLIFGTLIPFPRMLMNTMGTALSYSPVGFIKAWMIARQDGSAFAKLRINKELGKAITGSALITIGALLAAAGLLDFDDDDEYGGAQIILGNKIRIALSDFAPSAIPMIIGATITHASTEGFWNATTAGANALLDSTILGEALEIFGANKTGTDFIADSFTSFVNQFVPSVFRHVARTIDPTQKKYSSNKGLKVLQRVAASIPGTSLLVPSKVDPYTGDAIYQNAPANEGWARILSFFNAFSPAKVTANIESDVEIESKAVGAPTTGPAKTYTIDGVQYAIPDELYRDYQALRAKLYSSYAKEIINTSSYQKMTIAQKKAKLSQLQSKATQEARKQLNIGK